MPIQDLGLPSQKDLSSSLTSAGASLTTGMKQTWQSLKHMLRPRADTQAGGGDMTGRDLIPRAPAPIASGAADEPAHIAPVTTASVAGDISVSEGGGGDDVVVKL